MEVKQVNKYTGIVEYYDLLMTSGYYDYKAQSNALAEVLHSCSSVLELGVGTGLIAEQLIKKMPEIDFVGIDFTEAMLEKSQERLGNNIALHHENILHMDLEKKFDAAFSNGGIWYFIESDQKEYIFCSHIPKIQDIIKSFHSVANHLNTEGRLILSVQGVHKNYEQDLADEVTYCQEIFPLPHSKFDKKYSFRRDRSIIAEQTCRYQLLSESTAKILLDECSFEFQCITPCRQYHVYRKVT
ncbi:class I SAM-dependent methyltransferase [Spirulina sp. 06S082]|uniref:class I SAM-dependent methyltransferase n=1 Tax=Spirulina sp. 06S082 TaxID=3110248 RepID=UPI002B200C87|nr:class I SAM-dependent methyltransferase [Spirulina sp. 06S082]MEA5468869.1 class I SAM-dependent methyltransferase [Spirulina sp. 06S082]